MRIAVHSALDGCLPASALYVTCVWPRARHEKGWWWVLLMFFEVPAIVIDMNHSCSEVLLPLVLGWS